MEAYAMDGNEPTDNDEFLSLCRLLHDNDPNTTTVSIGCHKDQAKTAALCDALQQNTHVQRIRLDFANDLVASKPLLEYMQHAPNLSVVDLFNMNLNEITSCTTLLLVLKGIARNLAVRELSIEATLPDTSIFGRVSAILRGAQKDCLLLHSEIAATFRQLKFIEYLWLEHIDDVVMCQVLPSLRHMRSLKTLSLIPSLSEQSDTTFDSIGALLAASQSLQQLELHDCELTGPRMNAVVRGLWNSESVTEFGLHTSWLDSVATDRLRALYCRKYKNRGSLISSLTIGYGVKLQSTLASLLHRILGSGKSTLQCLDLKSREVSDDDILRYLSSRSREEDWLSAGWKMMTGHDKQEALYEEIPKLAELKWGKIKTAEGLALFEDLISNMLSLQRVSVEVDVHLDPARILSLTKSSNIEICTINGKRYNVNCSTNIISENQPMLKMGRRKVKRQSTIGSSDEEQKSFEGSFDGIGLEYFEAQEIDKFCDQDSSLAEVTIDMIDRVVAADDRVVVAEEQVKPDMGGVTEEAVEMDLICQADLENDEHDPSIQEQAGPIERRSPTTKATSPQPATGDVSLGIETFETQSEVVGSLLEQSNHLKACFVVDAKRRAPPHTRSDSAAIIQLRGRIADIRKYGGLRNDPFFFERRLFDLSDYGFEAEVKRPSLRSTTSDAAVLSQMQTHRAQGLVSKHCSQYHGQELTEENEADIAEELSSRREVEQCFDRTERQHEEQKMAKEIREQFASLIGSSGRVHFPSSEALSEERAVGLNSGLPRTQTADELKVCILHKIPDVPLDIPRDRLEVKRERAISNKEYEPVSSSGHISDLGDDMSASMAMGPQDESSPRSVASTTYKNFNHHAVGSVVEDDDSSRSSSSSSEFLDFDLELSKIMNN